jgi:methylated-DNA-[protein]-cysteine S-methyltransferase
MDPLVYHHIASPLGPVLIAGGAAGIKRIGFVKGTPAPECDSEWLALSAESESTAAGQVVQRAAQQLSDYFAGTLREFDLPLDADGNGFHQRVWQELCEIPYGETWSYGQLAERIGRPGAARAVGMANSRNPLPIVVPCHRVIGANGSLTGYAGGLHLKAFLLELEQGSGHSRQTVLL